MGENDKRILSPWLSEKFAMLDKASNGRTMPNATTLFMANAYESSMNNRVHWHLECSGIIYYNKRMLNNEVLAHLLFNWFFLASNMNSYVAHLLPAMVF